MCAGIFDFNFGFILERKIGICLIILGVIFGLVFGHFSDYFWGHFEDHFWSRLAQEGAKMDPRGPPRASNTQNPAFAKTLKTNCFSRFLGSRGLPRKAPEAHEGSQEAPKELQDLKNKGSKNGTPKTNF